MKKLMLLLVFLFSFTSYSKATSLDLDYYKPSPTKAFCQSLFLPGGGYYYLDKYDKKYEMKGFMFLALTVGSLIYLNSQLKTKDSGDIYITFAMVPVVGIRIWEFNSVIDDAEKERFKNMQKIKSDKKLKETEINEKTKKKINKINMLKNMREIKSGKEN